MPYLSGIHGLKTEMKSTMRKKNPFFHLENHIAALVTSFMFYKCSCDQQFQKDFYCITNEKMGVAIKGCVDHASINKTVLRLRNCCSRLLEVGRTSDISSKCLLITWRAFECYFTVKHYSLSLCSRGTMPLYPHSNISEKNFIIQVLFPI